MPNRSILSNSAAWRSVPPASKLLIRRSARGRSWHVIWSRPFEKVNIGDLPANTPCTSNDAPGAREARRRFMIDEHAAPDLERKQRPQGMRVVAHSSIML